MAATTNEYAQVLEEAQRARASGDMGLAYEHFARATEIDPNGREGWLGRAEASTDEDDALLSQAYAAILQPGDDAALALVGSEVKRRVENASPGQAAQLLLVGRKLAEVGLADQARLLLARSTELDPGQAEGWVWLAAVTAESQESETALRRALQLDDRNAIARAGVAALVRQRERAATRERLQQEAPVADSSAPAPSVPLGQVVDDFLDEGREAERAGDRARAYEVFGAAAELAPSNEEAWLGKSRSAETLDEKIACLEKVIELNPKNTEALQALTAYRMQQLRTDGQPAPSTERTVVARQAAKAQSRGINLFRVTVVLLVLLIITFIFLAFLIWVRL